MLAAAQWFQQGGATGPQGSSGTAAQPGSKAGCSGSALTQEGNTPSMQAPRALSCMWRGGGIQLVLHIQLVLAGSMFPRPDRETGRGVCSSQAFPDPSSLAQPLTVCDFGQSLISLNLGFPISLSGTAGCKKKKNSEAGGWNRKGSLSSPAGQSEHPNYRRKGAGIFTDAPGSQGPLRSLLSPATLLGGWRFIPQFGNEETEA